MPDVTFKNDTDKPVHIGIWSVWLHHYTNQLAPSASWTVHLASIPYTFEIRAGDEGTFFHPGTSGEAVGKIANAYAQGTASVLTSVGWGLGAMGFGGSIAQKTSFMFTKPAMETIGGTMDAAIKGGASYFGDRGPGHLLTVSQVTIGFDAGRYSVRQGGGNSVQLWDDANGCMKG